MKAGYASGKVVRMKWLRWLKAMRVAKIKCQTMTKTTNESEDRGKVLITNRSSNFQAERSVDL